MKDIKKFVGKISKGEVRNPAGRPKGARSRLSEDFISAIHEDWKQYGAGALTKAREKDPVSYIKVVSSLIPKEVKEEKILNVNFIEALKQINQSESEVIDVEVRSEEGGDGSGDPRTLRTSTETGEGSTD